MFFSSHMMHQMKELADEQEAILKIITVFPAGQYDCNLPSFEQFLPFYRTLQKCGYTSDSLYATFASGFTPPELDALIKEYAPGWPPYGKTVEGKVETPLLPSGE